MTAVAVDPAEIMYRDARACHGRGALARAVALYRASLDERPDHAGALNGLGLALLETEDSDGAAAALRRAVALDPSNADAWNRLGVALAALGQAGRAERAYHRAIGLIATHAEAHTNLGALVAARGRTVEAIEHYRQALGACPDLVEAHNNLGAALAAIGDPDAAIPCYRRALELDPGHAEAMANWGAALLALGRTDDAVARYEAAVAAAPGSVDHRISLAVARRHAGRYREALDAAQAALTMDPNNARAHDAYGAALRPLGRIDAAIRHFRRARALDPGLAEAHASLAVALAEQGEIAAALDAAVAATRRAPDNPDIRLNHAMIRLLAGELEAGFAGYGARWHTRDGQRRRRPFPQPFWRGQSLAGKSILVWGEQGIGEEIMFASALPRLIARARQVTVECAPRLVPLFARAFPAATVVAYANPPAPETGRADIDLQTAAGDVCRWLPPDVGAPPAPYLRADRDRAAALRTRYRRDHPGALVGISWRSRGPNHQFGAAKSSHLEDWAPVLRCQGATFVDLQYGVQQAERDAARAWSEAAILHDGTIDQMARLDDFAAQIAALDLVITTSNTTAHLAGALGVPVWVLLPKGPDWRWQLTGQSCLWYASARLFRQRQSGDWADLLAETGRRLAWWLRARPDRP